MKIKADFVTNSSSSSFVAMGISIEDELFNENNIILLQNEMPEHTINEDNISEFSYELLECLLKGTDLSYAIMSWDQIFLVGLPFSDMRDDETLAEFKKRANDQVQKVFNDPNLQTYYMEECWMDG